MMYDELVGSVKEAKELLEKGKTVSITSGCIGHTRNNMEQESFKSELEAYYGDRLESEMSCGVCRYDYIFWLSK